MKRITLYGLVISIFIGSPTQAQRVSVKQACEVALIFHRAQNKGDIDDSSAKQTSVNILPLGGDDTTMYAVSIDKNWVLVAGDLRVQPILAYSDENGGSFPSNDKMPPALVELLDWYDAQISYIRDSTLERNTHPDWVGCQDNASFTRSVIVSPLLFSNGQDNLWKQSGNNGVPVWMDSTKFYNKFCPSSENCDHALVGCVAVAAGQVMWYWKWPYSAIVKDDDGNRFIRMYNWDIMPRMLTNSSTLEEANMIANLLHDVGVSVNMNYGCNGSSAYPEKIVTSLRHTYHYLTDTLRRRSDYSNSTWLQMLKDDLDASRPILYGGTRSGNRGHRFVLDGYNSSNEFHVNYGWGEDGATLNGYYLLDLINNNGDPYIYNQSAILNIRPNYPSCSPSEIQWGDVHGNPFEVYGGTNLQTSNMTIYSSERIVIYAGNEIKIQPPFTIQSGANVHLAIRDMHCDLTDLDNSSGLLISDSDSIDADTPEPQYLPARIMEETITSPALVQPNPAEDRITIQAEQAIKSISIFDYSGRCVLQTESSDIAIHHLPPGMYIVRVYTSDGQVLQSKFVHP